MLEHLTKETFKEKVFNFITDGEILKVDFSVALIYSIIY